MATPPNRKGIVRHYHNHSETFSKGVGSRSDKSRIGINGACDADNKAVKQIMSIKNILPQKTGWLALITRLFLGGVFIYASVDKVLHPADFARAVYNYQILPNGLINLTALLLPWLELLLGMCLLAGVWLPGAELDGALAEQRKD
jgi:hypothetical protein